MSYDFSGALVCGPDTFMRLLGGAKTANELKAVDIAQRFNLGITVLRDATILLFHVTDDAGPHLFLLSDLEARGNELFCQGELLATVVEPS